MNEYRGLRTYPKSWDELRHTLEAIRQWLVDLSASVEIVEEDLFEMPRGFLRNADGGHLVTTRGARIIFGTLPRTKPILLWCNRRPKLWCNGRMTFASGTFDAQSAERARQIELQRLGLVSLPMTVTQERLAQYATD